MEATNVGFVARPSIKGVFRQTKCCRSHLIAYLEVMNNNIRLDSVGIIAKILRTKSRFAR